MPGERFIADGRRRLEESRTYRLARARAIAAVRARYAEPLGKAGVLQRLLLRLRMQLEISRELAKLTPRETLFVLSSGAVRRSD